MGVSSLFFPLEAVCQVGKMLMVGNRLGPEKTGDRGTYRVRAHRNRRKGNAVRCLTASPLPPRIPTLPVNMGSMQMALAFCSPLAWRCGPHPCAMNAGLAMPIFDNCTICSAWECSAFGPPCRVWSATSSDPFPRMGPCNCFRKGCPRALVESSAHVIPFEESLIHHIFLYQHMGQGPTQVPHLCRDEGESTRPQTQPQCHCNGGQ